MKILKNTFAVLLVLIALAFMVGLFLPSNHHLERSITIHAPASAVFEEVNNFKRWDYWSPWKGIDPNTIIRYEGPVSGVGSKMLWASKNSKVGKGSQEIIVSVPSKHITTRLKFEGWDGITMASWKFEEQAGDMTRVTWTNDSQVGKNIFYKYLSMMVNTQLGKDYENGLQQLKNHVETMQAASQSK